MSQLELIKATLADYPTIQNMAHFYVYDAARDCGFSLSENGLYEPSDYQSYLAEANKRAYIIKVAGEIAGFALLNQAGMYPTSNWKLDHFFILAKFQRQGVGRQVMQHIWHRHPGVWELAVIPKNKSALAFWQKVISERTLGEYKQVLEKYNHDLQQPMRIVFSFDSQAKEALQKNSQSLSFNFNIRRLAEEDLHSYFELRLESLQNAPTNFMTSYEEEKLKGLAFYQNLLKNQPADNVIFGAFIHDTLVGAVGLYRESPLKAKHKGHIWGVYVRLAYRQHGIGKALLERLIAYSTQSLMCSVLNVTVESTNAPAKRLYESFDFSVWGNDPYAMMMDGTYFAECHMSLLIR